MTNTGSDPRDDSRILPGKYYICRYCKKKMDSIASEKEVKNTCHNHHPLQIEHYFNYRLLDSNERKWTFTRMMIILPEHYRLCWVKTITKHQFWLQEWTIDHVNKYANWSNNYKSTYNRFFDNEWVIKQTPEKILSLFNMYKLFS